jgi:hypothetical protein
MISNIDSSIRTILCDRINIAAGGKKFSCKMIEPGIVSYLNTPERDVVLIRKETIDRCIASAIGNPLTINHVRMDEKLDLAAVTNGNVTEFRYNADDGWFYVDGLSETDEATRLIRSGWKPSCAFKEKKVVNNTRGLRYHGFHYDKEITELEFHHLAIVEKPRYEEAIFRLNSIVTQPMKNIFTLIREIVSRKNKADGTPELDAAGKEIEVRAVENIALDGNSEVMIGEGASAQKVRLNDLGKAYMDMTTGVIGDDCEIFIPAQDGLGEEKVRVNTMKSMYHKHRKNEADEKAAKILKDKEETERQNSLTAAQKEAEKAEADRKNNFVITLRGARDQGGVKVDGGYSTSSGSMAEKVAAGKKFF